MCGPSPTTNSRSWHRLAQGVTFALDLHATQTRKGTDTPYISHLLGVAGLVLEYGGSEDQAIAAMLHEAIEDQGAQQEPIIAERFGPVVARIVRGCTDTDRLPKPPWHERKQTYIDHLAHADADVLLVSAADKLHNARAICADLKLHGPALFDRFKGGLEGTLWYYESLLDVFRWRMPSPLTGELAGAVGAMRVLARHGNALDRNVEAALEMLSDAGPTARDELFACRLDEFATDLYETRFGEIVGDIIRRLQERKPLGMVGGSRNAWDEHALALARDEGFVSTATERRVWAVCTEVLDGLSAFERDLLLRMTEEYRQQWDADRPEPDDATARTWLVQDLERALSKQAMDHGFRLVDGDDD